MAQSEWHAFLRNNARRKQQSVQPSDGEERTSFLPGPWNNITVVYQNGSKSLGQITQKANTLVFCQTWFGRRILTKYMVLWCRTQSLRGGTCLQHLCMLLLFGLQLRPPSGSAPEAKTQKALFTSSNLIPKHLRPPPLFREVSARSPSRCQNCSEAHHPASLHGGAEPFKEPPCR